MSRTQSGLRWAAADLPARPPDGSYSGPGHRERHGDRSERHHHGGAPSRTGGAGLHDRFSNAAWRDESLGAVVAAVMDAHWGPPYGSRESEVVGLAVVLPDGTDARSRVAPRKAVGPDFDRVFLGSRGQLGIIYEVTLRIYPSSVRQELTYSALNMTEALASIRLGYNRGLAPRAIEILTPAPDRSWGAKRVGLSEERPVLVLVEPWGRQSSVSASF